MAHPLVVHAAYEEYDVYIGRWHPKIPIQSIWHNPFKDGTREENIQKFINYLAEKPELLAQIHTLKGKRLGCWCKPKMCHGNVLVALANDEPICET